MDIKKVGAAGFAVVAALLLAGCTPSGGYVEALHATGNFATYTDDELSNMGELVCRDLDAGGTENEVAAALEALGMTMSQAGRVVLAASEHLC